MVPSSPGWWNKSTRASDCQRKRTEQPLWLLNKVTTKNTKTFHLDISVSRSQSEESGLGQECLKPQVTLCLHKSSWLPGLTSGPLHN